MAELTSHKVNELDDSINVNVTDEPGQGSACHSYMMSHGEVVQTVLFQNGPIKEVGVNGTSNEALLAIVEHRLLGFQSGEYACRENAVALTKIQEAMMWLHKRTRDRLSRGVEGKNEK